MKTNSAHTRASGNFLKWLFLGLILLAQTPAFADPPARLIRVGIYGFPPLVSQGTNGNPQGLFIDVLNQMAKKQRWNLVFLKGEP